MAEKSKKTQGPVVRGKAKAKVNLVLKIVGRRWDGYHLLETLMAPISLGDTLTVQKTAEGGIVMECPGSEHLECSDNLAYKAAEAFFEAGRIKKTERHLRIRINKDIPEASGLGGGSSNAAFTLNALAKIWPRRVSEKRLHEIAAGLGADVAFFLAGKSTWMSGIGEVFEEAAKLPKMWLVLANPGYTVSTVDIYERLRSRNNLTSEVGNGRKIVCWSSVEELVASMSNDLEAVTIEKHPDLFQMKLALKKVGAIGVSMSGSGPTLFGLFDTKRQAEEATERLRQLFPDYRLWVASSQ